MPDQAREIREFWFGRLPMSAAALAQRLQFWFGTEDAPGRKGDQAALDALIRARFEPLVTRALRGELSSWAASPRRRLSLIILLDQFPRNIYRGTRLAFSGDEQALGLSLSGIQSGADAALEVVERMFFYMPMQHAESLEVQHESVAAYRRLRDEAPEDLRPQLTEALESAEQHRAIIERFGRFPQRNRALGRVATRDEQAYLKAGTESFGP